MQSDRMSKQWSELTQSERNEVLFAMYFLSAAVGGCNSILRKLNAVTIAKMKIPMAATRGYVMNQETLDDLRPLYMQSKISPVGFKAFPPRTVYGVDGDEQVVLKTDVTTDWTSVFRSSRFIENTKRKELYWFTVPDTYEWERFAVTFVSNSSFHGVLVISSQRKRLIEELSRSFIAYETETGITYMSTFEIDWKTGMYADPRITTHDSSQAYIKPEAGSADQSGSDALFVGIKLPAVSPGAFADDQVRDDYKELSKYNNWRTILSPYGILKKSFKYTGRYIKKELSFMSVMHAFYAEKMALKEGSAVVIPYSVQSKSETYMFPASPYRGQLTDMQTIEWNNAETEIMYDIWLERVKQNDEVRDVLMATKKADLFQSYQGKQTRLVELESVRALGQENEVIAQKNDVLMVLVSQEATDPPGTYEGEYVNNAAYYSALPAEWRHILSYKHKDPFEHNGVVLATPADHYRSIDDPDGNATWYMIYESKAAMSPLFVETLLSTGSAWLINRDNDRLTYLEELRDKLRPVLPDDDDEESNDASEEQGLIDYDAESNDGADEDEA